MNRGGRRPGDAAPDAAASEPPASVTLPVVIDLGKRSRKLLKQLKDGEGELWGEVQEAVREAVRQLGPEADGTLVVPIVVVYRRKPRRPRLSFPT